MSKIRFWWPIYIFKITNDALKWQEELRSSGLQSAELNEERIWLVIKQHSEKAMAISEITCTFDSRFTHTHAQCSGVRCTTVFSTQA